jgi:hypothetical protein
MRKVIVLLSLSFGLSLFGKALAVDPIELTTTVESADFKQPVARINPTPVVAQYTCDAALTNIGIHAPQNDCIWEGSDLTIWVIVHNAGNEIVDCAEVVFTLNGEEFARVHVTGLYPDEVRKYSATTVAPASCGSDTIAAHIDWPLDENPENDHIEDIFSTAGEADTTLQRDSGVLSGAWCWIEGYEYPDYALGSKWCFELGGIIKYIEMAYTNVSGRPGGHSEFFVMEADANGDIIDDGTGGIMNMEFQHEEIYWYNYAFICYPICIPVQPGDVYYFVWCNRQNGMNYWVIDECEDNPDWNWQKQAGVWICRNLYAGDWFFRVSLEVAEVQMTCESLTPVFCRGKNFYFKHSVNNLTGANVTGLMTFSGYSGYDCDPGNVLVNLVRNKTYPPRVTETYYYFDVPNAASPGQYSASISGTLAGWDLFCCMNVDIIQCSPFRQGDGDSWELVEVDRSEVALPTLTELDQNYPNPFNTETNISYTLAEDGHVSLKIYDISGRLVATLVDQYQQAREHAFTWDAANLSSGVYFYTLSAGDYTSTKKMNLLK